MPNPPQQTPTLEQHTLAYNEIQSQLSNAQTEFSALKGELDKTKQALQTAQMQLAVMDSNTNVLSKLKKPGNFTGKESVLSWTTHMSNCL